MSLSFCVYCKGHSLEDASHFGWGVEKEGTGHDWPKMVNNIQEHIGSLNWGYRVALRDKNVKYFNGLATFIDPHTIKVGGVCDSLPFAL